MSNKIETIKNPTNKGEGSSFSHSENSEEKAVKVELKFTKQQLLKSSKFSNRIDALSLVVKDDEELTITEVQKRLNEFMKKREVKK